MKRTRGKCRGHHKEASFQCRIGGFQGGKRKEPGCIDKKRGVGGETNWGKKGGKTILNIGTLRKRLETEISVRPNIKSTYSAEDIAERGPSGGGVSGPLKIKELSERLGGTCAPGKRVVARLGGEKYSRGKSVDRLHRRANRKGEIERARVSIGLMGKTFVRGGGISFTGER